MDDRDKVLIAATALCVIVGFAIGYYVQISIRKK